MSEYKLELKQLVDYPRCRIYREFLRNLMQDKSIHSNGCSYFFCFLLLCSYANFRTSYRRVEGITYTIYPGEWICKLSDITKWFRKRFQYQAVEMLDYLQEQHYIAYSRHANDKLIKFKIEDWAKFNTVLEYNAPCQKDTGFFFFPICKANELINLGKCSELDIVLDLWINTVYNETQVQGSDIGPVVYFRNCTGDPFVSYSMLADRWNLSKSTVGRIINKLAKLGNITLVPCKGKKGSIIYLNSYLSVMFEVSDVMIDKEEVAMSLQINIRISKKDTEKNHAIDDEKISVLNKSICVPYSHIKIIVKKVAEILAASGISCCECDHLHYLLYSYPSDCREIFKLYILCGEETKKVKYRFRIRFLNNNSGGVSDEKK